ncbi:fatty acyl-CoA hydrolase precursor, medium chain-like, partial [Lagopus leucura]|uniref:fatty acyl-CoA hydrolase precursor, medium chain-like n=1 Tax=Lagopus leucura TaxID=30410 RepID=UPI001C68718C
KLPVFVWIHGGALVLGSASFYDGSALAAFDNVVVVAIQYRLGIAGYFSTGDRHARGNWGYLDQVAALQWIQENIIHFGGDPGSVTICGESAGGISVSALVLSPLAKGLFHKAISESGTTIRTLFTEKPEKEAQVGILCRGFFLKDGDVWSPARDTQVALSVYTVTPFRVGSHYEKYLSCSFQGVSSHIVDLVFNEYIGEAESRAQVRDALFDAIGDHMFTFPAIEVARYHRDAGHPVYFYEFQHRPSSAMSATGVVPEFVKADHADEIAFVFGRPFLAGNATEGESKLSRTVMKYWTNFARNGNPNGEGLVHWPQYGLDERYLEIDLIQKAAKKLKEDKMEFWVQLTEQMRSERRREHTDL